MNHAFKERLERATKSLKYAVEELIIDFTEQLVRQMSSLGINKAELAERFESSPAYITKMLKGENNFTIETMVKAARALDSAVEIRVCPKYRGSEWFPSESESVIIVDEKFATQEFQPLAPKDQWRKSTQSSQFRRQNLTNHEIVTP
jgi:transcriptional regulator with XRE-family HTH domain